LWGRKWDVVVSCYSSTTGADDDAFEDVGEEETCVYRELIEMKYGKMERKGGGASRKRIQ
jgi:hypothetical protein